MSDQTKPVTVHVNGLHAAEGSTEKDSIGGGYSGVCRRIDDTWYIRYEEPAAEENAAAKVLLKLREDCLEIKRRGEVTTELVLRAGQRTEGKYISAFGTLPLVTDTQQLVLLVRDPFAGIHLRVMADYDLEMDGQKVSTAHLDIAVHQSET